MRLRRCGRLAILTLVSVCLPLSPGLRDGASYTYPACPPSLKKGCTMSSYRDKDGNQLRLRHDARMNLVRIETQNGLAIDLTYDARDRIVLARSSYGQQVEYHYDPRGRLVEVVNAEVTAATYAYDARHQMVELNEPGVSVTNTYDDEGRCVTNDVRIETRDRLGRTQSQRSLFTFAYTVNAAGRITATEVARPTSRRKVTFNEQGYRLTETVTETKTGESGTAFDRADGSNVVQRLTVWCGPRNRPVKVEAAIDADASMESIRRQLQDTCEAYGDVSREPRP
jgi:YD repeat-containing protein